MILASAFSVYTTVTPTSFVLFCRKSAFGSAERKTPMKKLVAEFSKVKCKSPKSSPLKEEPGSSLTESVTRRELRSQETPEKGRSLGDSLLKSLGPLKGAGGHAKDKSSYSETEDLPYLSTTEMYLCRWHQPPPSPLREPSPKKEETVASKKLACAFAVVGRMWVGEGMEPTLGRGGGMSALKVFQTLEDNQGGDIPFPRDAGVGPGPLAGVRKHLEFHKWSRPGMGSV